jgi:hypothetical protein
VQWLTDNGSPLHGPGEGEQAQGGLAVEAGEVGGLRGGQISAEEAQALAEFGLRDVACCWFGGHRDKVFQPYWRFPCSGGYSVVSSKLRR